MNFTTFFVLAVIALVVAPGVVVPLAGQLIDSLMPIAKKGLEFVIIVAVIGFILR